MTKPDFGVPVVNEALIEVAPSPAAAPPWRDYLGSDYDRHGGHRHARAQEILAERHLRLIRPMPPGGIRATSIAIA